MLQKQKKHSWWNSKKKWEKMNVLKKFDFLFTISLFFRPFAFSTTFFSMWILYSFYFKFYLQFVLTTTNFEPSSGNVSKSLTTVVCFLSIFFYQNKILLLLWIWENIFGIFYLWVTRIIKFVGLFFLFSIAGKFYRNICFFYANMVFKLQLKSIVFLFYLKEVSTN